MGLHALQVTLTSSAEVFEVISSRIILHITTDLGSSRALALAWARSRFVCLNG